MKARILVPVIGASLALIGPATHAAGARNALHCTAATKQAHAAVTTQKPFFSPLNPRGLLAAHKKSCVTKKKLVTGLNKPKSTPKPPVTVPAPPVTVPAPPVAPAFPTTPSVSDPYCLTYLDYPEAGLAPCTPAEPSTAVAPAQDGQDSQDTSGAAAQATQDTTGAAAQATQDTTGEPPLAAVDTPAYYDS